MTCPKCKNQSVKLFEKVAKCTDEMCGWLLFRNVCGKTLSESNIKTVLEKGKSPLLKGLKSKAGKTFDAYIILKADGGTEFEFTPKPHRKK